MPRLRGPPDCEPSRDLTRLVWSPDLPAALPDLLDACPEAIELVRVAADDDQIGQLPFLDRAEPVLDAEEPRRFEGRRVGGRPRESCRTLPMSASSRRLSP